MAGRFPQLRFHLDTGQQPSPLQVTAQFKKVQDYNLGQLSDDPALVATVINAIPSLQTHADQLLEQHWTRLIPPADHTKYDLDILIRVVEADWCPLLPEANGIQGQWEPEPAAKILLICSVPDAAQLSASFIHEFGHYLDYMNGPGTTGFRMAHFLRDETAAEQLVVERLGASALTHDRMCTPSARAEIHRLLTAEGDLYDTDAQDAVSDFFDHNRPDCRQRILEAYALSNELVRRRSGTFAELLRIDARGFRESLLSSPDLWLPSIAGEPA